jgi:hypothetical protein
MDALNTKLAKLQEKQATIQKQKDELDLEERSIEWEIDELEKERLTLSQKMTSHQEDTLKKELTALGELLELPAVILASLELERVPPTESTKLYTISIETGVTYDSGLTGLYVKATVQTLCPQVEAIMRSLFVQEGHVGDKPASSLTWEKHWDYSTRISLTTHEALSW